MIVSELIDILKELPSGLIITTYAVGHTCGHGDIRVALLKGSGWKRSVCIGDLSRRDINFPNDFVIMELDGGDEFYLSRKENTKEKYNKDWGEYDEHTKHIDELCEKAADSLKLKRGKLDEEAHNNANNS